MPPSHPATFNSENPDHWITVASAAAQLFIALAPVIVQLIAAINQPKSST